jgi:hypothetical protein
MNYIQHVLNDRNVQEQVISMNENVIGYMVQQFPIITKDIVCYVNKNKKKFVRKDLQSTKDTIKNFGETVSVSYLNTCSIILESELSDSEKIDIINEINLDAIMDKTKSISKDVGRGVVDTLQNPFARVVSTTHLLTWFASGILTKGNYGHMMQGGKLGELWHALLIKIGFIPPGAVSGLTGSLMIVSMGLLALMVLIFISMRLLSRKDAVLVYSLNSKMKDLLDKLKRNGFKNDLKDIEAKSSINMFQVKSFKDCQKTSKCVTIEKDESKKYCMLNCFFDFFINKELSKIVDVYFNYIKSIGIDTKNITSMTQLFNRPVPTEMIAIQNSAIAFSESFYRILKVLYKEDYSKQTIWIDKINKIVEKRSKSSNNNNRTRN